MASHGAHLEHHVPNPRGDFPCGSRVEPAGSALVPAPAHLGDRLLLPSAPQDDSGPLMCLKEILGARGHTRPIVIDWRLAGGKVVLFEEPACGGGGGGWHPLCQPQRSSHKVAWWLCASSAEWSSIWPRSHPPSAHLSQPTELFMGSLRIVVCKSRGCYVPEAAIPRFGYIKTGQGVCLLLHKCFLPVVIQMPYGMATTFCFIQSVVSKDASQPL